MCIRDRFKVLDVKLLNDKYTKEETIALLAGIEGGSSHPIAQSIIRFAEQQGIRPASFDSIDVISGAGVEGKAGGHRYQLISQKAYGRNLCLLYTSQNQLERTIGKSIPITFPSTMELDNSWGQH